MTAVHRPLVSITLSWLLLLLLCGGVTLTSALATAISDTQEREQPQQQQQRSTNMEEESNNNSEETMIMMNPAHSRSKKMKNNNKQKNINLDDEVNHLKNLRAGDDHGHAHGDDDAAHDEEIKEANAMKGMSIAVITTLGIMIDAVVIFCCPALANISKRVMSVVTSFGAGVFLVVGIVHILGEATAGLEAGEDGRPARIDDATRWRPSYVLSLLGYMLMLFLARIIFTLKHDHSGGGGLERGGQGEANSIPPPPFKQLQQQQEGGVMVAGHSRNLPLVPPPPPGMQQQQQHGDDSEYNSDLDELEVDPVTGALRPMVSQPRRGGPVVADDNSDLLEFQGEDQQQQQYQQEEPNRPAVLPRGYSQHHHTNTTPKSQQQQHQPQDAGACLKVAALCVMLAIHAVIEGIALGLQHERAGVLVLFAAIMCHHWAEDLLFAIETGKPAFLAARRWLRFLLAAVLSCMTGFGAGIGWSLEQAISGTSTGVLLSISSGTFIYIALSDMVSGEHPVRERSLLPFIAFVVGCGSIYGMLAWLHDPSSHSH